MRVTFVAANRETLPDPVVPLGVLYVMRAIADAHSVTLIDLMWEEEPVAIGLRNIQNADYSGTNDNISYYEELMVAVRGATDAPVVGGGGGFSVLAAGLMHRLRPDFGVVGEGERALAALVEALAAKPAGPGHQLRSALVPSAASARPCRAALAAHRSRRRRSSILTP